MSSIPIDINIDNSNIDTFDKYIDTVFTALDISPDNQTELKKEILKFNDKAKFKLISNKDINKALQELISADDNIKKIKNDYDFFKDIEIEWKDMTTNLANLQTLILLENIKKQKCSKFIDILKDVLTSKINSVNSILETNIKTKNTEFSVAKKYLKYKNKYINLKKDI